MSFHYLIIGGGIANFTGVAATFTPGRKVVARCPIATSRGALREDAHGQDQKLFVKTLTGKTSSSW